MGEEEAGGVGGTGKLPHSWTALMAGLVLVMAGGLATVLLLVHLLQARPLDLRYRTAQCAGALEQTLTTNGVPAGQIRRSPPEDQHDDGAIWQSFEFDADLPSSLSLDGVAQLVWGVMTNQDVSVVIQSGDEKDKRDLRLSVAGREFALVRLTAPPERMDLTAACQRLAEEVAGLVAGVEMAPEALRRSDPEPRDDEEAAWCSTRIEAVLPASLAPDTVLARIETAMSGRAPVVVTRVEGGEGMAGARIAYQGRDCVELTLRQEPVAAPPAQAPAVEVPQSAAPAAPEGAGQAAAPGAEADVPTKPGKLAILVDDGGYGGDVTDSILALDKGLTLAILPNATHTAETAQRAVAAGFEVILHMPMENEDETKTFPGRLGVAMKAEEIRQLTEGALRQVPGAVGVNNHEGSKFTADANAMGSFLDRVKEHSLYFVDSRTVGSSVAYTAAKRLGIRAAARDVFLDNDANSKPIREQFKRLVTLARERGSALGICHFRAATAETLAEMLPALKDQGVELVHLSELLE